MLPNNIQVYSSVLFQTNTYLIHQEDSIYVVDPFGTKAEIESWTSNLLRHSPHKQIDLIFTHADYDHILAHDHIPARKRIANVDFLKRDPQQIRSEAEELWGFLYLDWPNWSIPQPDYLIEEDGKDEETKLHFLKIPGHTIDGLAIWVDAYQSLVVGDHLSILEFPFIESSAADYAQSLKKLEAFVRSNDVAYVLPGHGPAIEGKTAILERIGIDLEYLHLLGTGAFTKEKPHDHLQKNYRFHHALQTMHDRNIDRWSGWISV